MSQRRCIAVRSCLALLIALSAARASAQPREWLPLEPGRRWVYDVHRDHSYIPDKGVIDRVFHTGKSIWTARAADAIARGAVAIEERTRIDPLDVGTREETFEVRVFSNASDLLLLGSGPIASEGDEPNVRYEPPLLMQPTGAKPGDSWKVGTYRDREMSITLRGEVTGLGKLADAPGCESCLEVHYTGPIAGRIPIYGGDAEIQSGSFERRAWYQRGTGIVRDVTTVTTELILPDKQRAKTAHTLTFRLAEPKPAP